VEDGGGSRSGWWHMDHPTPSLCASFRDLGGLSRDLCAGLFSDEATSDVTLCVQGERLPAHRALLAARSPVFRAMFFGSMKERCQDEVEVSTFAAPTMRLLLRFVYAGCLEDVHLEDMVPLMACADHYGVSVLRDTIGNHLRDSITPETACTVLALARSYQQEAVTERYLAFILTHAQQVTRTEGFLHLDAAVLAKVLEADEARIEEIDLFKALVRWYRHWAKEPDGGLQEKEAARLFGSVRYAQMTGQQLVAEVRPLAGEIVPRDLYVRALEQVAAPGFTPLEACSKQAVRRQPPIGVIQTSDPSFLTVSSTEVRKVGPIGWNCTAIIEPSTSRTCFKVDHLADAQNGAGIAIFDPERNALRGCSNSGFPNPNQWGADCLVGIYGSGCFFSLLTDHVLRWKTGLVVEVTTEPVQGGSLCVQFAAEGGPEGERICAETVLPQVPELVKLAVALYSPEDKVSIESVW